MNPHQHYWVCECLFVCPGLRGETAVRLLIVLSLLCQHGALAQTQSYQIEGSLAYRVGERDLLSRQFELVVSNCHWAITVDAGDVAGVKYYQIVQRAGSIFCYTAFDKQPGSANFVNSGGAVIMQRDVPLEDGSFANYVWLGLASACLFREYSPATNAAIPAIWQVNRDSAETVRTVFELFDQPPFLPNKVVYYQGANIMPPPFEHGWRAAELRVLSKTNINGLIFPQEFVIERFKPKPNAASVGDLEKQAQVSVTISRVRLERTPEITPPISPGITLIEERRLPLLPNAPAIVYASSNNVLPSLPDQMAVKLHATLSAMTVNKASENTNVARWKRHVILVFMILAMGALSWFAIGTLKNKQQQKG